MPPELITKNMPDLPNIYYIATIPPELTTIGPIFDMLYINISNNDIFEQIDGEWDMVFLCNDEEQGLKPIKNIMGY